MKSVKKAKSKSSKKMYFGNEVQEKIIIYQKENCVESKHKIYRDDIFPAFNELVQSLVSVYGFKSSNEDIDHLKSDCITFLYETLPKWDSSKGTKAFSYFNVCAKRYLTIHSKRLLKLAKRSVYLDDKDSLTNHDKEKIYDQTYDDPEKLIEMSKNRFKVIMEIVDYIEREIKEDRDKRCCIAIRKIYNDIENIDFFNKRAVFVYLREISGLNPKQLSVSLSSIRKHYRDIVKSDDMFLLFG